MVLFGLSGGTVWSGPCSVSEIRRLVDLKMCDFFGFCHQVTLSRNNRNHPSSTARIGCPDTSDDEVRLGLVGWGIHCIFKARSR